MQNTPKANRIHIGIFGKRNAGKSTLFNTITQQDISIVSETAGTTTDIVQKSMEMLPLGPIVLIDTAGIDDIGELGEKRINSTKKTIDRIDIAIIASDYNGWNDYEYKLFDEFKQRNTPVISVITKQDVQKINSEKLKEIENLIGTKPIITDINDNNYTIHKIKEKLIYTCPDELINTPSILGDIVTQKDTVILVIPIDKEAPKGRLILPQVQVIRDLLDNRCKTFITQETELKDTLSELKHSPKLIITDSQAFAKVVNDIPINTPLTSFSILFARLKVDLSIFYQGAKAIENLNDNDKVLICESCTHHQIEDDIAKVKIPKLLTQKTNKKLEFVYHSGHDFPENLDEYSLLIHCGACMTNKKEVLSRIAKCQAANLPITNYGITIAHCLNILDRAVEPFKINKK